MEPKPKRKVGRAPVYDEPTRKRNFYPTDGLWLRLSREVDMQNLRIDDPEKKLNISRLIVDYCYAGLGLENPARKER